MLSSFLITEITAKTSTNNRKNFTHSNYSSVLTPISSPHHIPTNSSYSTHSVSILASSLACELRLLARKEKQFGELKIDESGGSEAIGSGQGRL